MEELLKIAIDASIAAGKAIMEVYQKELTVAYKKDTSPITEADKSANAIIVKHLSKTPYPIISEESKEVNFDIRQHWTRCWMVDPLDGTKEFIKRNGEFTVNIALIDAGKPVLGVIYIPATGQLYLALNAEQKAYTLKLDKHQLPDQDLLAHAIPLQPSLNSKEIRVVGSRSHMNETTLHYIESLKSKSDKPVVIVSKGSSLKFCLIAEGKAEVYPRFAPTMEWDTAAGHALCNAVGIQVIDTSTLQELKYNKAELLNSYFCVVNERSFI